MHRLFPILLMTIAFACGGDDGVGNNGRTVGGPCVSQQDCRFRCETGGDFPQGYCVVPCNTDDDCPTGSHCINDEGGICMLACNEPADCRGGYNCEGRENRGHGGDSLVCSN